MTSRSSDCDCDGDGDCEYLVTFRNRTAVLRRSNGEVFRNYDLSPESSAWLVVRKVAILASGQVRVKYWRTKSGKVSRVQSRERLEKIIRSMQIGWRAGAVAQFIEVTPWKVTRIYPPPTVENLRAPEPAVEMVHRKTRAEVTSVCDPSGRVHLDLGLIARRTGDNVKLATALGIIRLKATTLQDIVRALGLAEKIND